MKTYSIREISELFSLPASTLRYYESEGLLPNVEKSSSGQRALSVISLKGTFGKPRHTKIPIALLPNPLLAF